MTKNKIRVALVVPHIFFQNDILPNVIFSPGTLALDLANNLGNFNIDVTLFSPGPIDTKVKNINADLSYFKAELAGRNDNFIDLLKKHPFVFATLARQVQAELITKAYDMANSDEFDIVHIYTNEEDIALPFAKLCKKPVVFTHHDPFNFLIKYKNVFPKYKHLNWISLSLAQRSGMPVDTNWVANIYHGLDQGQYNTKPNPDDNYIAFLGRIVQPKGLHLAIKAINAYNASAKKPIKLKIAGKHYADTSNDDYWQTEIEPNLSENIEYVGFIKSIKQKNEFLANAKALIIPSIFDEPFGMVMIESLASGTPIIGLSSGSIPEIINDKNGLLVEKDFSYEKTVNNLKRAIENIDKINRADCRQDFEDRFTIDRMCKDHADLYFKITK